MQEEVVLVNASDEVLGRMEKLEAHRQGLLHRAFSIFIFHSDGSLLVQRRSPAKYHSGGLWTNTCCGHPRPEETTVDAASRRLWEEMRIEPQLTPRFTFSYRADLDGGLVEHELDHVYFGMHDGGAEPDPLEADAWRYMRRADIDAELEAHPERYTVWFKLCWSEVKQHLEHIDRSHHP
ncbi:MAG: isopentenyl-diphosphate Delta-isomerase [Flavobacteriales bacterium]|nr:isopentenyl-diphosphate Delta-isomerase [Flavobacteriales bacterium]